MCVVRRVAKAKDDPAEEKTKPKKKVEEETNTGWTEPTTVMVKPPEQLDLTEKELAAEQTRILSAKFRTHSPGRVVARAAGGRVQAHGAPRGVVGRSRRRAVGNMPASKDDRALDAEEVAASLHGRVRQAGAHEFVYVQDLVDALRQSLGHDRHEGVANQTVSMTLNKALEDQQKAGVLKLFSKKKSSGGNAPKFMGIKLARDVSAAPAAAGSAPHAAGSAAASAAASGGADGSAAAASAACTSVAGIWDASGKRGHVDSSQHACCKTKHVNIIRICMLQN